MKARLLRQPGFSFGTCKVRRAFLPCHPWKGGPNDIGDSFGSSVIPAQCACTIDALGTSLKIEDEARPRQAGLFLVSCASGRGVKGV